MKTTFVELGIPFPLHDALVKSGDETGFVAKGLCAICGTANAPCFRLGIGSALIISCPACQTDNGLDVHDKSSEKCRKCGESIPFPANVAAKREPKTCYECLRAGKAALSKSTEFGLVSWDQAFAGVTNGRPGMRQDQFESVVIDADENWVAARLPQDIMFELLRTPNYGTWQGERWLFCCRYPMTFVGEWDHEGFDQRAADGDGEKLYYSIVEYVPPGSWDGLGNRVCAYVFECRKCGGLRAHYDFD